MGVVTFSELLYELGFSDYVCIFKYFAIVEF